MIQIQFTILFYENVVFKSNFNRVPDIILFKINSKIAFTFNRVKYIVIAQIQLIFSVM